MSDEKPETEAKTEAGETKPSVPPAAEAKAEATTASEPPPASSKSHNGDNHAHGDHGHEAPAHGAHAAHADDAAGHGLAHTMPIPLLIGVLGALMALTVLTVSVTHYDLGSEGNLVVAMIIATVKAALVVTFFMHLLWDKKFHLILFLTAVLFVVLFLSMSITDRGEYQPRIDEYGATP